MAKKKDIVPQNDLVSIADIPSADFFERVAGVIEQARKFVGRTADLTMSVTYFAVGQMIVEREQGGKARAEYGVKLIPELSKYLTAKFKKGFSETNIKNARTFYLTYSKKISQAKFSELSASQIRQTFSDELAVTLDSAIGQTFSDEFMNFDAMKAAARFFKLGWSHYTFLMRIENEDERRF